MIKFKNSALVLALGLGLGLAALPLLADDAAVSPAATTVTASVHHHHHHHSSARAKPDPATETMMKQTDCFTCHSVDHKIIGPAYKDVAAKYRGVPGIEDKLVAKVRAGGSGNWGSIPMVAHPNLSDAQLHAMVKWVLAH